MELGNFVTGVRTVQGTGFETSRLLLREIDGVLSQPYPVTPASAGPGYLTTDTGVPAQGSAHDTPDSTDQGVSQGSMPEESLSQDWGRKFLGNGGCAYVDLNHLEVCIPEVLGAFDHLAASHAMFRIAQRAADVLNTRLPHGLKAVLLANNSDGRGHSYGTHLNVLITRRLWEDLFHRRLHCQLLLAAYQVSSIVFTGLGKVGSENNRPHAPYQISQRADFFEILAGPQTTYERPIVNSRDESLCANPHHTAYGAPPQGMARLHVIFYDNNLCHAACVLKVGVLQIILAMIESGFMDAALLLDNPITALRKWSHDPDLRSTAKLVSGANLTAVELQWKFFEAARSFVEAGRCEHLVPEADRIMALWEDTLAKLHRRDFASLTPRLDWVLKRAILDQALRRQPGLNWESSELNYLDQIYSNLNPREGLFYAYLQRGLVERHVTEAHIDRFVDEPPHDTRAWTRASLLKLATSRDVDYLDWNLMRFSLPRADGPPYFRDYTVNLDNPLGSTRAESLPRLPESATLQEALDIFQS